MGKEPAPWQYIAGSPFGIAMHTAESAGVNFWRYRDFGLATDTIEGIQAASGVLFIWFIIILNTFS